MSDGMLQVLVTKRRETADCLDGAHGYSSEHHVLADGRALVEEPRSC